MKTQTLLLSVVFSVLMLAQAQCQALKIEQLKENTFHLTADKGGKLAWNTQPDSWKTAKVLPLKSTDETVELPSAHPIVRELTGKKDKPLYAAPREIKLQGAANFRDLGGYLTQDGKQVKWGKMYRSADISKLTDADLKIVSSLNIKIICDLRGEKEVEAAPDRLPQGTDRILLSAGSENIGGASSYMKYLKSPETADSMMVAFYSRTDHLKAKYKPMFDRLLALQPDQALMFHCTAGKDRTGVGAALVLTALGVDKATVMQDYEATNEYRKTSNEQYIKMMTSQGISETAARNLMAANPKYLASAFEAISKKYGSVDAFLEKEMELTAEKRNILKAKFLY